MTKHQRPQLMLPTVDYCFKELMRNEKARTGFIAAILGINPNEIDFTELVPTILRKEYPEDKVGILDVRVIMNSHTQIDLEMQVGPFGCWAERTVFYLSKMFTEQIKQGDPYENLVKCIHIGILDFILFEDIDEYYSCFHLREDTQGTLYTDIFEIHVLELPKIRNKNYPDSNLLQWAKFLSSEREENFEKMALQNEYIGEAYETLKHISKDALKRLEYNTRLKATLDYNHQMASSKKEGMRIGLQEGEEKGANLINQLIKKLKEDGRIEDILNSCEDKKMQTKLLKEYHLINKE